VTSPTGEFLQLDVLPEKTILHYVDDKKSGANTKMTFDSENGFAELKSFVLKLLTFLSVESVHLINGEKSLPAIQTSETLSATLPNVLNRKYLHDGDISVYNRGSVVAMWLRQSDVVISSSHRELDDGQLYVVSITNIRDYLRRLLEKKTTAAFFNLKALDKYGRVSPSNFGDSPSVKLPRSTMSNLSTHSVRQDLKTAVKQSAASGLYREITSLICRSLKLKRTSKTTNVWNPRSILRASHGSSGLVKDDIERQYESITL